MENRVRYLLCFILAYTQIEKNSVVTAWSTSIYSSQNQANKPCQYQKRYIRTSFSLSANNNDNALHVTNNDENKSVVDSTSTPSVADKEKNIVEAVEDGVSILDDRERDTMGAPSGKEQQQRQQQQQQQRRGLTTRELMTAMGTSPRRVFLGVSSATGIALAGNLFGVTSNILQAIPEETVEGTGLDTYFPRGDFKRYNARDYTFVIPKEWVADTFVELAKAQRKVKALDYNMKRNDSGGVATLPDAAFGPPGRLNNKGVSEEGDTNVSVILNPVGSSFSLKGTLGNDPKVAAEFLLSQVIAPEGSSRVATLIGAEEDISRNVYQFEYDLIRKSKPDVPLRAISVITGSKYSNAFITMTVIAPKSDWENNNTYNMKLRKIASSFHARG